MTERRPTEPMPMREFLEAMAKDLERGALSPWLTLKDHRDCCADWVRNIRQQIAEHPEDDLMSENKKLISLLSAAIKASDTHPDGPMLDSKTAQAIEAVLDEYRDAFKSLASK